MGLLSLIERAVELRVRDENEFCVLCGKDMGFPWETTHIHDPIRYKDGAHYVEGCGQLCAECKTAEK